MAKSSSLYILGIETSCDDTSICLLSGHEKTKKVKDIHFFKCFSHEEFLAKWGGVVPELAARNHLEKLAPLLEESFSSSPVPLQKLDAIAVTTHPGLLGPLLTGVNAAKTLSLIHQIPIIAINHLYAHLEAIHLVKEISYPYLGLLVSGGHSLFFQVNSPWDFKILGQTIDDAAGEAFDKGGRLLGLSYPCGSVIDQLASCGNENTHSFPIGLEHSRDTRLSFSGLKTSLRHFLEKNPSLSQAATQRPFTQEIKDILASYQWAIVKALALKLRYAIEQTTPKNIPIVVGGGVACNSRLRSHLLEIFTEERVHFVPPKYCTDNGAMIANLGLRNFQHRTLFPQCLNLDAKGVFEQGSL